MDNLTQFVVLARLARVLAPALILWGVVVMWFREGTGILLLGVGGALCVVGAIGWVAERKEN